MNLNFCEKFILHTTVVLCKCNIISDVNFMWLMIVMWILLWLMFFILFINAFIKIPAWKLK